MALTDLTNTTWIFPNPPDMTNYPYNYSVLPLDFESNGTVFAKFYASRYFIYYYLQNGRYREAWTGSSVPTELWEKYKTIHITGGQYATNPTFIAWIETHATQFIKPYRVYEPALTATADAIRARGGTAEQIEWKANGFADAITNMVVPIPSDYGHIAWDGHTLTVS